MGRRAMEFGQKRAVVAIYTNNEAEIDIGGIIYKMLEKAQQKGIMARGNLNSTLLQVSNCF